MSEASLEQRIARLEDMEAIRRLISIYARNLDDSYNPDGVAALFSESGEWIIEGKAIKGREAIRKQCALLAELASWTMHNLATEIIRIEDRKAACSFYGQALQTMKGMAGKEDAYIFLSVYEAECVKENGEWLFSKIEAHTRQAAEWSLGWVESPSFEGFFNFD